MRRWARASAAALVLLSGCGPLGKDPPPVTVAPAAGLDADAAGARALAAAFIAAEAAGDAGADTLLATGADFIATGIAVTARPRLAGMTGTGTGLVEQMTSALGGGFAWVTASYRFDAATPALGGRGRVTMVLEKQRAGWRIRHVHSSAVERW